MIQIKTFTDQVRAEGSFAEYVGGKDRYYRFNTTPLLEKKVNAFCKKHNVVSVTPAVSVLGNNPPTSVMTYTIVYEKTENDEN